MLAQMEVACVIMLDLVYTIVRLVRGCVTDVVVWCIWVKWAVRVLSRVLRGSGRFCRWVQ